MHFCTINRIAALLLLLDLGLAPASAQSFGDSPYSAYGLGDLVHTGQAAQALMGGTGLAITEPYSVLMGNPASYASLARPVFEVGTAFRLARTTSATASSTQQDAQFMGFSIGVPFASGKWGLAMGLTPFSEVDYASARQTSFDGGTVKYAYAGSGGLDRAFLGLARTLFAQRVDSLGNRGMQLSLGADFNFIFGSIGQTRDAVYNQVDGYLNTRAYSSLVLRAPTADASLIWQGDLTRKRRRDDMNWRWSAGVSAALPAAFSAKYANLVTSYSVASGIEQVRDTILDQRATKGRMELPLALGLGVGVQNARWAFTLEVKQRDWSALVTDVPGHALPAPLRMAVAYAAAARFQPSTDGSVLRRSVYRAGLRYQANPQEVHGQPLSTALATLGVSLPLNAVQTNSWLHVGGELGQRGSTGHGLVQERVATLWIGVAFTPWRGERWFTPPRIQ